MHLLTKYSIKEERMKQNYYYDCDHVFFCSTYYNNHKNGIKHKNVVMCNTIQNELNEKINRLGLI